MLSYCLKCRKKTENKSPQDTKTNKKREMLLSKLVTCNKNQKGY